MKVEFRRTGRRRYMVRTQVEGQPALIMDPAPGYDDIAPHDLFHYVVEQELGIALGIFGQLAAGGDAGTFYLEPSQVASRSWRRSSRRVKARGSKLCVAGRSDAEWSEQALGICEIEWRARARAGGALEAGVISPTTSKALVGYSAMDQGRVTPELVDRVCCRLAALGAEWRRLEVGQSLLLEWEPRGRSE